VGITNSLVASVLRSPLHRLLSGSTALIRYTGRRSGREIVTPVQFAQADDVIVIAVGHPEKKAWWHNFETEGDLDVLVRRTWVPMSGLAIDRADDPDTVEPLFDSYLDRFPRAARVLGDVSPDASVVVVRCRRRPSEITG
jgi:deazaflavin-dependent oxidoreductase (nitroreductase family)